MDYIEFNFANEIENKEFPLAKRYSYNDSIFYIEPIFYTMLQGMLMHHKDKQDLIINKIKEVLEKNKKVVFCGDFENIYVDLPDYIYREITDITDPLLIFVEDKSRGSDYGD